MSFTVTKFRRHTGNDSDYYTIKVIYKGIKLNITYDIHKKSIVVHEWYKLTEEQLLDVQEKIDVYIKNNTEQ